MWPYEKSGLILWNASLNPKREREITMGEFSESLKNT